MQIYKLLLSFWLVLSGCSDKQVDNAKEAQPLPKSIQINAAFEALMFSKTYKTDEWIAYFKERNLRGLNYRDVPTFELCGNFNAEATFALINMISDCGYRDFLITKIDDRGSRIAAKFATRDSEVYEDFSLDEETRQNSSSGSSVTNGPILKKIIVSTKEDGLRQIESTSTRNIVALEVDAHLDAASLILISDATIRRTGRPPIITISK